MFGRNHKFSAAAFADYHYRDFVRGNQCHYEISIVKLYSAPKLFHSYIRKMKKCCPSVGPLKLRFGEVVSSATEMNDTS